MALIRLSAVKDELYAPDRDGNLVPSRYNHQRTSGFLGRLPDPVLVGDASPLWRYLDKRLTQEAAALAAGMPVVVLVHGFLFDPEKRIFPDPPRNDNPHGRLYHFQLRDPDEEMREHTTGWPLGLGFADADGGAQGLAVGFGWYSSPGLAKSLIFGGKNHYARAYEYAERSAWCLVNVLAALAGHPALAGRPIDLFCHSLGSRVVVRALAMMADAGNARAAAAPVIERVGRVVLLGGSEYVVEAQLMMHRLLGPGRPAVPSFYNVVSRENDVLDTLGENFGPVTFGNSNVIGHKGLGTANTGDHWIDLRIDSGPLRRWMAERGEDISGDQPGNVWDHWYYYTYRGNMRFYAKLFRDRANWVIPELRAANIPAGVA